ncbi:nucleoid-associated protein YejK [Aestuariibacter salexigens]|uniref:nucleoid-associated protein YejK n=1 Tax=Aestuariibacter salexigens TaxID=226010 RepID=UPI0003FA23CB|nr:nucleoid-associated protein YejK [Aestuariibacter salexigens]
MSAVIHHFVVHQLALNDKNELAVVPRQRCFDVTPDIETLATQINSAFNQKPGKGVGSFVSASDESEGASDPAAFSQLLDGALDSDEHFALFSIKATQLLKQTLLEQGMVETGFVVFSHYEFLATKYLLIALLNTRQHVEINQQLELNVSDHLDVAKMQLAVRIDLTQLEVEPQHQRYISFIKGRMGRKVSDFFMQFIGCEELVDVKQQNKQLIQSVDEYLAVEQLDPQEKHTYRKEVTDYYKEKLESGDDISVKELSGRLPSSEPQRDFYAFSQQSDTPIEAQFQADRAALKSLSKFSGQGGGISLSFDRVLLGDRITYNADTDTLTITGLPPNLRDQLSKKTRND